jgi:hypothetical protein
MPSYTVPWDPFHPEERGVLIRFSLAPPLYDIADGRNIGLEYAVPSTPTALIDTGSPFTIVNTILARSCNLMLTNPCTRIKAMGGDCVCEEYCGSISFPGTGLPAIPATQILATDLASRVGATHYAGLIGRNILKYWDVRFDGPSRRVTITSA